MKRYMMLAVKTVIVLFALAGLYRGYRALLWHAAESRAEKIESSWNFDPILKYNKDGGEPFILTKPENKASLIFMEGFRTQNPAGMYLDFLTELHDKYHLNIFVPVYGLQSSPFSLRYRQWRCEEDMRTGLLAYDAYTANLPKNHRIITVSQSFGTLPHTAILLKAKRSPDKAFFLSPLNSGMEYRAAGDLVFWLSKQVSWIKYIIPFTVPAPAPNRASVWDIVNTEKNLAMAKRFPINPEDSSEHGDQMGAITSMMETGILPGIKGKSITVINGDSDLYFAQSGFEKFSKLLADGGNSVDHIVLKNSGHMVLLDNDGEQVKKEIIKALIR